MTIESNKKELSGEQKKAIENALEAGNRVELIPVKNGVKIMLVKKNELKMHSGGK